MMVMMMEVAVSCANSITRSCSLNHSGAPATQVSHLHDADDDEYDEHDNDDAALV